MAKPAYKDKSCFNTQENKLQEDWDHFREYSVCVFGGEGGHIYPLLYHFLKFFSSSLHLEDVLLEQILHRVPMLQNIAPEYLLNGPECFTPDGKWILGEAPKVSPLWIQSSAKLL